MGGLFPASRVADRGLWDVELVKIFVFHKILELKVNYTSFDSTYFMDEEPMCPCSHNPSLLHVVTCEWSHSFYPGLQVSWCLYSNTPCYPLRIYIKDSLYSKTVSARMLYYKTKSKTLNRRKNWKWMQQIKTICLSHLNFER